MAKTCMTGCKDPDKHPLFKGGAQGHSGAFAGKEGTGRFRPQSKIPKEFHIPKVGNSIHS